MKRRMPLIKTAVIVLAAGLLYYLFITLTGISIPCVFRRITGLKCPGCGITRAFIKAVHFDFIGMFRCNPVAVGIIFMLLILFFVRIIFMPEFLSKNSRLFKAITILCCAALIIWGIVRNLSCVNL